MGVLIVYEPSSTILSRIELPVSPIGTSDAVPQFSYSASDPSSTEPITFDASGSQIDDGTITQYQWEFGDGSTGTGENPTHTYATSGTYTVTLTVTDDQGETASESNTILVGSSDEDVVGASADGLVGTGSQSQDLRVTLGNDLDDSDEITIDLSDTTRNGNRAIDYANPSVSDGDGTVSLNGKTLTYTADGTEASGETLTISVTASPEKNADKASYTVAVTGNDTSTADDTFSVDSS